MFNRSFRLSTGVDAVHANRSARRSRRRVNCVLLGTLAVTSLFGSVARAAGVLPQGGQYVGGQGTIAGNGNRLVITQPGSTRGVIDWNSFSIGANNKVIFDNGSGATLNRVTGGSPSSILGNLSGTGSVYLINPQGVLVGRSGVVSTGGRFVASTLDASNCDFLAGDNFTLSGTSNASVVNLGKIGSSGGDVFLIARESVMNGGTVKAPNGTAEFAVGSSVLLQDSASSQQVFVQTGSAGSIFNTGSTRAAQINLQAADGNIYALAGGGARIRATGTASRDGHVWLVADTGQVSQTGTIAARNADGTGGTVDTQAGTLSFGANAAVKAGQWNVTTPAFTIDADAARALRRSLNRGTSVDVSTSGANGASGDLSLASNLKWKGDASLTLAASHSVSVAPGVTLGNTGAGNLTLRADAGALDNGGSVTNGGTLDWSRSTGMVSALYDLNGTYTPGTILTNSAWTAPSGSGLVTQYTAYKLVNSATDLANVSLNFSGNYALGKDIDAGGLDGPLFGMAIGGVGTTFLGQFDGMGHTISNFAMYFDYSTPHPEQFAAGLFATNNGVVRNVSLQGSMNGEGSYGGFGLLVGNNQGTLVNDHTSGSINVTGGLSYLSSTGGLAGWNSGTITRSSSSASVTSEGDVGGLVGLNYGNGFTVYDPVTGGTATYFVTGVVQQSSASGAVTSAAHGGGGGGLVGNNAGLINESYATGSVTFNPDYCGYSTACTSGGGGLVRVNSGTIEQSFATGQVIQPTGSTYPAPAPAGIAYSNSGTIGSDVFWNTQTTGATAGVVSGTAVPASQGLTTAQMSLASSFGPTYDFSANGVWALPAGETHPVLRWQVAH